MSTGDIINFASLEVKSGDILKTDQVRRAEDRAVLRLFLNLPTSQTGAGLQITLLIARMNTDQDSHMLCISLTHRGC